MPHLFIGCAGWSIPSASRHLFGEGDSMLARYATRFNAVEINSSFYRPHQQATYRRWAQSVPPGFRFSAKLPRAITHDARLRGIGRELDRFVGEIEGLGRKLALLLVQLPPSLVLEPRVASTFFAMLRKRLDVGIACEARHASWFTPKAQALFQRHAIARVATDPPVPVDEAHAPGGDPRWRYWRWHGSPRTYYSSYDEAALRGLAEEVRACGARGRRWIVFDNTAHGHAIPNAVRLQELLEAPERKRARSRA